MAKDTKIRGNKKAPSKKAPSKKAPSKKAPSKKGGTYMVQTERHVLPAKSGEGAAVVDIEAGGDFLAWIDDKRFKAVGSTAEAIKAVRDSGHEGMFRVIAIKAIGNAEQETRSTVKLV